MTPAIITALPRSRLLYPSRLGKIREPRPKMRMGVAHELRLVVTAQQRRDHRQGDKLRVRQLGGEPQRRPPRHPLRGTSDRPLKLQGRVAN